MSFASPLFLLALLVVPAVLGFLLLVERQPARNPVAFTNIELLAGLVAKRRPRRRWITVALLLLALATAAAATARPRANLPTRVDNATVILLVDVSASMSATDVEPTRLDAAVAAMRTFVDRLPKRFKVGVVQFSDASDVMTAPTDERQRVLTQLGFLEAESGTAIGAGIVSAIGLVQHSLAESGVHREPGKKLPAAIVLLSDGKQTKGAIKPLQAAARARAAGIPVDTIALGTPTGTLRSGVFAFPVPPDPALMRAIAAATGGATSSAVNSTQLTKFYSSLGSSIGRQTKSREITSWFALAAGVLLVGAVGLGRLWAGSLA